MTVLMYGVAGMVSVFAFFVKVSIGILVVKVQPDYCLGLIN